ncbi:hypothetical protein Adt_14625 [Abeliophyllum distichum]|uniref:Uncharacterized protein n=1 Tax=Abeliophyllum distichum TaxID=126358 RepID=A0ABD1U0S7_9LAMI
MDSQRTIHFSCLISGLCLAQDVSLFPTEEADPACCPIKCTECRELGDQDYSPSGVAECTLHRPCTPMRMILMTIPQHHHQAPAPAAGLDLSVQMAQLMAAQTEMGRAIGTIQGCRFTYPADPGCCAWEPTCSGGSGEGLCSAPML